MTNEDALAFRRFVVCVLAACASWQLSAASLFAQQPLLKAARSASQLEQRTVQQQITVDRQASQALNRLRQLLTDRSFSAAAKLYREVLVGGATGSESGSSRSDSVFWSADGKLLSVRAEARSAVDRAGPEISQSFEDLYGAEASAAVAAAVKDQDLSRLSEVARQHFFTVAGFQALERFGTWQFDAGQFDAAAASWIELLSSQSHARRVTVPLVRKTALALALAGRRGELEELVQSATTQLRLDASDRDALEKLRTTSVNSRASNERDWATPFGNVANNLKISGSAPYLRSRWSHSLIAAQQAGEDILFAEQLESYEQQAVNSEFTPLGAANMPVVTAGQLVVRDTHGLTGFELDSGRVLWRYRAPTSAGVALWSLKSRFQLVEHRFELAHVGNAATGMPSSFGDRIFSVEVLGYERASPSKDRRDAFREPQGVSRRGLADFACEAINRLVCVRLPRRQPSEGEELQVEPDWIVSPKDFPADELMSGCTFLGPPLPVNGAVFVLGEMDRAVYLLKFDARTGALLLTQPLCVVEMPLLTPREAFRLPTSNLLAFANGSIICPTETGLLVAVDALFGEVKWVKHYSSPQRNSFERGHHDQLGWPDPPHVDGDSVFYLPRLSDELLRINVQTGELRWSVSRNEAKYIATVTPSDVIVVGDRWVRGISRETGKSLWTTEVGVVSGRAAALPDMVVVPLKNGGVVAVDLKTGKLRGIVQTALTRSADPLISTSNARADLLRQYGRSPEQFLGAKPLGNLIALRDRVVSVGLRDVTVFTQAEAVRSELAAKMQRTPADDLADVGAQLAIGRIDDDANVRLNQLLSSSDATTREIVRRTSLEVEQRRFYTLASANNGNDARDSASRLLTLSQSREEQLAARMLLLMTEERNRAWAQVTQAARKLHELGASDLVSVAAFSAHAVSPKSLTQRAFARSMRKVPSTEREALLNQARPDFSAAQRAKSVSELERFLDLYGELPEAAGVRLNLADRLIREERFHEAEHWLRITLRTGQRAERAAAQLMLLVLLAQAELPGEAARALDRLSDEFADVELQDLLKRDYDSLKPFFDTALVTRGGAKVTGRQIALAVRSGTEFAQVVTDRRPLNWDVQQVRVVNRGVQEARTLLADLFAGQRRLETGSDQDVDVLPSSSDGGQRWSLIDRTSGTERGEVSLSSNIDVDFNEVRRGRSHVIPLGMTGGAKAVSLLTPRVTEPLWELSFPLGNGENEDLEVTTISPSVCLLRTANHLVAVNSANGSLLWRRSDLLLAHGIVSDLSTYLFGDDDIIVAFQRDGQNYVLLDARTGETLRVGRQLVDRQGNIVLGMGRRLLYVTRGVDGQQPTVLQLWDPLTDRIELQSPFNPITFPPVVTRDNHVAVFQVENDSAKVGRFLLLSPEQGLPVLDVTLALPTEVRRMDVPHVFVDGDLVFINLRRNDQKPRAGERLVQVVDSMIPTESLHYGDLIAIRRSTRTVLWHRACRTQAVLRLNRCNLPFLVTAVLVQPSASTDTQTLAIQVIDKESGTSLTLDRESRELGPAIGSGQACLPMRFAHYGFDRQAGRLSLYGLTRRNADFAADSQRTLGMVGRIDLEFSPGLQRFLLESSP